MKTKIMGSTDQGERGAKETSTCRWVLLLEDQQRAAAGLVGGGVAKKPDQMNPQPPRDWKYLLDKLIRPKQQTKSG